VVRNVRFEPLEAAFATVLDRAERILASRPETRTNPTLLYAMHAPEVGCIHCPAGHVNMPERGQGQGAHPL